MNKDESLDRLLRRTSASRTDARPQGPCLDAETLAAWTDGSLTSVQRAAAEAHAADCERCLAVLAAIARSTPPPFEAQRPSWFSIRWLVPLATAAIAITAWVLIQAPPEPPREAAPAPPSMVPATPAAPTVQPEREMSSQVRQDALQKSEAPAASARSRQRAESRSAKEPAKDSTAQTDRLAREGLYRPPRAASEPSPPPPPASPLPERSQPRALEKMRQPPGIVSPDPNVRWRIAGAAVERSADGGLTWQTQSTGATVDLLAGASPSPSVCWIVGRRGIVLLSTDGATWRRLDFPDSTTDLVAVTARDALSATVTTADKRSYRTDDGGRTWTLQETSAAPF